jgi:hypothetical protein
VRAFFIVRYLARCIGRGEKEREREIYKLRAQIELYAFILIYYKAQFYGRSPRER